jgi:hypothetical protein
VIDMIKKLLVALLLISPFSFADWGDTYDCKITHYTMGGTGATIKEYQNMVGRSFQFQLVSEADEKILTFGDKAFWVLHRELSVTNDKFSSASQWLGTAKGTNTRAIVAFEGGSFAYSWISLGNINSLIVLADCDKF